MRRAREGWTPGSGAPAGFANASRGFRVRHAGLPHHLAVHEDPDHRPPGPLQRQLGRGLNQPQRRAIGPVAHGAPGSDEPLPARGKRRKVVAGVVPVLLEAVGLPQPRHPLRLRHPWSPDHNAVHLNLRHFGARRRQGRQEEEPRSLGLHGFPSRRDGRRRAEASAPVARRNPGAGRAARSRRPAAPGRGADPPSPPGRRPSSRSHNVTPYSEMRIIPGCGSRSLMATSTLSVSYMRLPGARTAGRIEGARDARTWEDRR